MSTSLTVSTFGGLRVLRDDAPVAGFVSRKVEALLIYLICNPREHPREALAELLWDDLPSGRALANLRTALSDLQKQLAPYLLVTRQHVAFNYESPHVLDLMQLDMAFVVAEREWAVHGRLAAGNAADLDTALSRYHGAFLDGFQVRNARGFEGWRLLEAERTHRRAAEGLYLLATVAQHEGRYRIGIGYAERALRLDPLWEAAHRCLMQLLALTGQRGAALAQYETCRRLLREELDIDPEVETEALFQQIQFGNVDGSAAARAALPPAAPHTATASHTPPPMLTRQQKILLRQSFGSIAQAHHEVSRSFYDRLFELDPTVKGLFRHNLEDQRMKLMGMLAIVVTSLDNLDFLITAARDMGRRHARYGVKPGDYATVRAALLYALGRSCPHVMTPPIEAAWAALYDLVAYNALRP